ncbi:hypothetical protein L3Q82_005478 [Scortum barcoo]|uniref:Uncharacterized protein n=1 Tax=Scortum barcoo TaxID=214431 RepID=A0ACB8VAQ2_9TELE|nr:hypothetical protein L3Q82_005478 [Scortum barcoo]
MVLAEVGCVFMGFILCISGIQGQAHSICGSSVDLPCSAEHHTSSIKSYTVDGNKNSEISADENRVPDKKSEDGRVTKTIKNLTKRDAKLNCCRNVPTKRCQQSGIQLIASDVQVKVIPSTEGQTVTLMCSTSCALTENPAAYIWYKNGEFLYEDWSPWYQQLVSSDKSVRYSCAIKGYEDLRAPEVSVDSVTSTCFSVTYAKGRMCSFKKKSEDESCSITYPRGPDNKNCWSVNYVSRRICVLEGSSVNISSEYLHPDNQQPKNKFWYRRSQSGERKTEKLTEAAGRVEYHDNMKTRHVLRIQNLKKNDSAEYKFRLQQDEREKSDLPGVFLIVTDLKVTLAPSAVVTEGQRVTLSCSTSCPLTDNTNYIWYLNSRPLTPPQNQNKHLVLDPVSSQHEGNYSCVVETHNIIISREQTLTVYSKTGNLTAAAAGVCAVLLVLIPLAVCLWIRRKRASGQFPQTEAMDNTDQLNLGPVYENIQLEKEDELHYSRVHFSKTQTDALYSTVQPHQPRNHEDVAYAVVNFRRNMTPNHNDHCLTLTSKDLIKPDVQQHKGHAIRQLSRAVTPAAATTGKAREKRDQGVQGRANSICALKGSSVDLPCSAVHHTSSMKWYIEQWKGSECLLNEIPADEDRVTYNMLEESHFTLTIKDLRESDEKFYCCKETTDNKENCKQNKIELRVTNLQVKVIPSTEGQTVTLMCSTNCALTENPAAYIWYKNGEFLYEDWSPWYQQLVSSDKSVRYSCAIKGYEDLRAPEVSVDSVTSTCFNVTYAKGRMYSYKQTSEEEPCSITYPREIRVQITSHDSAHVTLTCNTSCPLTSFIWYKNKILLRHSEQPEFTVTISSSDSFSCAVKGLEDLHSTEVCVYDTNCWSVNYVSRRICALSGSSVNISSEYSHPVNQQPKSKLWYKIQRRVKEDGEELMKAAGRLKYRDMKNHHIMTINNLTKNDSAEYTFRLQQDRNEREKSDLPGVFLIVTDLKVTLAPSAVVTEGQRVTLSCSTSCPLTDNTNYIWYLNSRPLTPPQNQNKDLVLDPVSTQHAGSYSCAVKTGTREIISAEKTLTVQTEKQTAAAAAGVCAVLLVLIPLAVCLWIRRKRTLDQSPGTETSDNLEQRRPDLMYENISAQCTEQDDHHYSRLHFSDNHTHDLYSTLDSLNK